MEANTPIRSLTMERLRCCCRKNAAKKLLQPEFGNLDTVLRPETNAENEVGNLSQDRVIQKKEISNVQSLGEKDSLMPMAWDLPSDTVGSAVDVEGFQTFSKDGSHTPT